VQGVWVTRLMCNGGGAGWCDAKAATLDGDEGGSWSVRRERVRGRRGGART
jgi:hypothetical protein